MASDVQEPTTDATTEPAPGPDSAPPPEESPYGAVRVDVPALATLLDGRYADIRATVREGLVEHAAVLTDAETMTTADFRERVRDVVVELASTGQTGMGFPKEYGGGGDIGASIAAFETLGFGDLSVLVKVGVQFGLFGGAILQLGTKRHHDAYLQGLVKGEILGCFAMTETGHGSNVQALGTTATYDPETQEFVIQTPGPAATKDYIGNAARHAQLAVVFAQLLVGDVNHGVHALVVPLRDGDAVCPGVTITDDGLKMGLNGVDNGRIVFDGVRVPRDALLDQFAQVTEDGVYHSEIENPNRRFFTMLGTLVQGRVCVGAAGLSAAKVALTIAVEYGLRRRQFEGPVEDRESDKEAERTAPQESILLDYGMHQRRLLPLLARTYALHFAQQELTADLHEVFTGATSDEVFRRQLESRAAGTKALATWHATRTIQECREACGGAGYLAENRFAALKADTDVFTTFEGDNHVLLQLVAKGLLTDYASDFSDLDQFGMVRFVAGLAVETVLERSRAHKLLEQLRDVLPGGDKWDQDAGLLDPNYHRAMFEFREEHMIGGVARRLKRGVDSGLEAGEVFSRVQDHVVAAARAHVERLVLDAFLGAVAAQPDGDLKTVLNLVCDLHALSSIEADRAWFMEHGRLTSQRSKAISREVTLLCRQVRPVAGDLVRAFGVPREMLRAESLLTWGEA